MAHVCPTPDQPADQSKQETICYSCGNTGHIQAEWQEMVVRRREPNLTSATSAQPLTAMQPRVPNTQATSRQRPVDTKRLALVAKEINEGSGRANPRKRHLAQQGSEIT